MSDSRDDARADKDRIGASGEELAAAHLADEGWTIRARNVVMQIGELDIVASRQTRLGDQTAEMIAFVEVKTRASSTQIPAEVNVTRRKRRKLNALAKVFLDEHDLHDVCARFDIITVDLASTPPEISHYPAAFDADGRFN